VGEEVILNRLVAFIRACINCRLAWIVVFLHAAWFFVAIANMSPPSPQVAEFLDQDGGSSATVLAGRPFHFHYESYLLKCLFVADLPSMVAAIPLDFVVAPLLKVLRVGSFVGSYFGAGLMLLAGTLEWLALGKIMEDRLERRQSGRWVIQKLNRYWVPAIVLILLFTIIATPMVNKRSRQLGFRHAGISFH
jgi:hypothetical protein